MKLEISFKKIALNLLYLFFFWPLTYLVPKQKNLLLLGSSWGKHFSGNPKHFYLYLRSQKNLPFKFYWITLNKELFQRLKKQNFPVLYAFSLAGIYKALRAALWIIDSRVNDITGVAITLGNFSVFQTSHGTPLKKIEREQLIKGFGFKILDFFLNYQIKRYKLIISASETVSKSLETAYKSKNIKVLGYPRNDLFYNPGNSLNRKKSLLFAPTFREIGQKQFPLSENFLSELNPFLQSQDSYLLIKNHPFEKKFDLPLFSNIREISGECEDVQEILAYAELVITDYSSLAFDFALSNRPIIFYIYDLEFYKEKCRKMYYNIIEEFPGPFARNENELYALLKNYGEWSNSEVYRSRFDNFRNRFNEFQDGHSSQRLFKEVNNYFTELLQ